MVSEANVIVSVSDPDDLIAGTSNLAPFAVTYLQVFRFTTEALARAAVTGADNGTLATTFTLIASTEAVADPNIAGPFRWGYYDSSQLASSWYSYRFTDSGIATVSQLSDPWQAGDRLSWAVRDIIPELSTMVGGTILTGTVASASAADTFVCTALFQSARRSSGFYTDWHLMCSYDAGGGGVPPEGEDALVYVVTTASGTCQLDRAFSVSLAANDKVILCAFASFTEILAAMNRAREQMQIERTIDIAITGGKNRYPAPPGVKAKSDILAITGVRFDTATGNDREYEFDLLALPVQEGQRIFIDTNALPGTSAVARVRYLTTYRDADGPLLSMASTTTAPIEWMRPAFGWELAKHLVGVDPTVVDFQRYESMARAAAEDATGRFAPDIVRDIRTTAGGRIELPGPVAI